jgi:hypothetical protein
MATRIPEPPPNAPRSGGAFSRWLGRSILRLGGWTIEGNFADEPRMVHHRGTALLRRGTRSGAWRRNSRWAWTSPFWPRPSCSAAPSAALLRSPRRHSGGSQPVPTASVEQAVEHACARPNACGSCSRPKVRASGWSIGSRASGTSRAPRTCRCSARGSTTRTGPVGLGKRFDMSDEPRRRHGAHPRVLPTRTWASIAALRTSNPRLAERIAVVRQRSECPASK